MHGYIQNFYQVTLMNTDFRMNTDCRRVVSTGQYGQLLLDSLKPGEETGFKG